MLVLTRKAGEMIQIDGDIVIQIVKVRGRQVRIGIKAPKDRKVQRGELIPSLQKSTSDSFLINKESSF